MIILKNLYIFNKNNMNNYLKKLEKKLEKKQITLSNYIKHLYETFQHKKLNKIRINLLNNIKNKI